MRPPMRPAIAVRRTPACSRLRLPTGSYAFLTQLGQTVASIRFTMVVAGGAGIGVRFWSSDSGGTRK